MNPRVAAQSREQLARLSARGNPGAGMPAFAGLSRPPTSSTLARYLRRINVETILAADRDRRPARATWGPPQPGDWLTYNGNDSANRYSPLKQITPRMCRR